MNINLNEVLVESYNAVLSNLDSSYVDETISPKIDEICRCEKNKAPIRFLMSCLLAKIKDPIIDVHKPHSKLEGNSFSGRTIDEKIIQPFIHLYKLPCNSTTAYLTPAFRTIESPLTEEVFRNCRPKEIYVTLSNVLDYIEENPSCSINILKEILRVLLNVKNENERRMIELQRTIRNFEDSLQLSSEDIINLVKQHLAFRGHSRLPVLIIAAVYQSIQHLTSETHLPLNSHNAADCQTGSLGDLEIIIGENQRVVTCYEMKNKRVSTDDINVCIDKIASLEHKPNNYIIITTENIENDVLEYAKNIYDRIGTEFVILDCIGFVYYFLHFFHRYRLSFLNKYQELVLEEPSSSVSQPLKEAFLALRRAAEAEKIS